MAATQTSSELAAVPASGSVADLLVSISPLSPDGLDLTLNAIKAAFPDRSVLVASPDPLPAHSDGESTIRFLTYTPSAPISTSWVLTAADFLNTWKLITEHSVRIALLLGPEAHSLRPEAIRALAETARTADLVTPRYELGPHEGLVNSAILYPVTRALFGSRPRFPLAIDLGLSAAMAERLATVAQRSTAAGFNSALVWPVSEAAAAGLAIAEVPAGPRGLPPPDAVDLNALLAQVAGSFFSEIDSKAAYWQRARLAYSPHKSAASAGFMSAPGSSGTEAAPDAQLPSEAQAALEAEAQPMLDSFRLAYTNLGEIWSLVLPPNSLLGLKRLSVQPTGSFRMPDALWARIVYDFILAYRLRTINRGHLLGALTPLYLAWVGSHLLLTSPAGPQQISPERHIESQAAAFEADKPYLVSRWRWPDRFNP